MTTETLTGKRSRLIGATLIVLIAAGALALWLRGRHFETTDDAQVDGHLHAISARTTGTVLRINPDVQNNHFVEAGTLLLELDPADNEVALAQAQAKLATQGSVGPRGGARRADRAGERVQPARGRARRSRTRLRRTSRSKKPT